MKKSGKKLLKNFQVEKEQESINEGEIQEIKQECFLSRYMWLTSDSLPVSLPVD